jgi:hypothetical protein
MTMNAGIARALRRFGAGVSVILAGLTVSDHLLFTEIQVPPADVDRVVVTSPAGRSHEITHRATVAGIVHLVRSRGTRAARIPGTIHFDPGLRFWSVAFHRGTGDPEGFLLTDQLILTQGALIGISANESLDLHRLLGAAASPAPVRRGRSLTPPMRRPS